MSANTIIVRVSSWTSEKIGLRKDIEMAKNLDLKNSKNYENDNHIINCNVNEKNKLYVKKVLEANNQLQTGKFPKCYTRYL